MTPLLDTFKHAHDNTGTSKCLSTEELKLDSLDSAQKALINVNHALQLSTRRRMDMNDTKST